MRVHRASAVDVERGSVLHHRRRPAPSERHNDERTREVRQSGDRRGAAEGHERVPPPRLPKSRDDRARARLAWMFGVRRQPVRFLRSTSRNGTGPPGPREAPRRRLGPARSGSGSSMLEAASGQRRPTSRASGVCGDADARERGLLDDALGLRDVAQRVLPEPVEVRRERHPQQRQKRRRDPDPARIDVRGARDDVQKLVLCTRPCPRSRASSPEKRRPARRGAASSPARSASRASPAGRRARTATRRGRGAAARAAQASAAPRRRPGPGRAGTRGRAR